VPRASGLHLVAACDAHNRQLVSRRRILKYSMYTMIQALEVRATAGRAAAAGRWPETPGVSDFAKYRAPRTHRERHVRAHERASKTVQPTLLPPRSGICARGRERARTASPSWSVAQAEHGERPDKTVQALAHRADRANIPQGIQCTETSATMLEQSPSHVPQPDPRKELLQRCVYHGPRTSHGHTHASVSLLYYPYTPQLRSTRYILPHTEHDRVSPKYQSLKFPS
jgi:hypothetical protein